MIARVMDESYIGKACHVLPGNHVVILGGGFGGIYAALEFERALARDADVDVTLVNRDNFFLFTPMLHEVAASDLDITNIVNPIRKLLRRVTFFHGDIESIDLANKRDSVYPWSERTLPLAALRSSGAGPRFDHELLQPPRPGRPRAHDEIAR